MTADSPLKLDPISLGDAEMILQRSITVTPKSPPSEQVEALRINRDFLAKEQTRLLGIVEQRDVIIDRMRVERILLAKLASDTPQFDNPLGAFKAQELRDKILSESLDD